MAGAVAGGLTKTQNLVRETALIFVHAKVGPVALRCPVDSGSLTSTLQLHYESCRTSASTLGRTHSNTPASPSFSSADSATEGNKTAGSNHGNVRLLGYDSLTITGDFSGSNLIRFAGG